MSDLHAPLSHSRSIARYLNLYEDSEHDYTDITSYRNVILVSNPFDTKYIPQPPPSSYDAYTIWVQADIPYQSSLRMIEIKLIDWAFSHAIVDAFYKNDTYVLTVTYKTSRGTLHFTSWSVFLKWIVCASRNNVIEDSTKL